MEIYTLKKPNLKKINQEELSSKISSILLAQNDKNQFHEVMDCINNVESPKYLYWDKTKHKKTPNFLNSDEFWMFIKVFRRMRSEPTPITTPNKNKFAWVKLDRYSHFFHELDLHAGGKLFSFRGDVNHEQKMRYISRGIMEEAIASSQLEGAHTSRKAAKQMIREGRGPKSKSERMILNNYHAMQALQDDYKDKPLTKELLFEMHRMITADTLEDPESAGKLDSNEDRVQVWDHDGVTVLHTPPTIEFVDKELDKLIALANDEIAPNYFVHPLVKAIMLHFWIGYLHPFSDGNGRIARLLFYWYLLRKDYWAFAYLPISSLIKKMSGQYKMAYIYTEQDDEDLTYFIDYNIQVVQRAIEEFNKYVTEQFQKNAQVSKKAQQKFKMNERQIEFLQYFSDGDSSKRTQTSVYSKIHNISIPTASADLKMLEKQGFIERKRIGKNIYYYPTEKIKELLTSK